MTAGIRFIDHTATDVVSVVDRAGIGKKVARLRPMGVLKG